MANASRSLWKSRPAGICQRSWPPTECGPAAMAELELNDSESIDFKEKQKNKYPDFAYIIKVYKN